MLKGRLLHPELLRALGQAGHGSKVLISDGNYPHSTKSPQTAAHIYLNFTPGVLSVTDVLNVLVDVIPIEAAEVMVPPSGPEPPVFAAYREILGRATTASSPGSCKLDLTPIDRWTFYDIASEPVVAVVIATADQRFFANLLLTIGTVNPNASETT